jgi:hypothetical protein
MPMPSMIDPCLLRTRPRARPVDMWALDRSGGLSPFV